MRDLLQRKDRLFYGRVIVAVYLVISTILYGTTQSFGVFLKRK